MQVLELVHGLEFHDIQTVREDSIGFPFQQMLALVCRDVTDSRENVRTMCCRSLYAVSMVDTAFSGLMVYVEILKIVVEIDRAGAKVATEKCRVGSKDSRHVYMAFST